MALADFFKGVDINSEVENCKKTEGAVLLDVRSADEYKNGHIPGSINVPVDEIQNVVSVISDKNTPIFAYCLSGGRAGKAVKEMQTLGYTDVKNIGGISKYTGIKE